jgi:hypothetical protein
LLNVPKFKKCLVLPSDFLIIILRFYLVLTDPNGQNMMYKMTAYCKCVVFGWIGKADVSYQAKSVDKTKTYFDFCFIQCKPDIYKFYVKVNGS